MTQDEVSAKLNAIKALAAELMIFGGEQFKAARPEEYAAMSECATACGVTVRLTPALTVECWAAEQGGERQTFATLHGERADLKHLN